MVGFAPLMLLMVARTVTHFYGEDFVEIWSWLFQSILPILGIIIASWSVGGSHGDSLDIKSPAVFWITLGASLFYILVVYLVVLLEPISNEKWVDAFRSSGIYLGVFQSIVAAALGKFFIENIHNVD
jgi:hypothetical protein